MFDKTKVENGLLGLVGYRASLSPDFFVLTPANLQSDSGYYVNDSPYAELETLKDTLSYSSIDEIGFNSRLSQLTNSAITSVCNAVFHSKDHPDFIDRQYQFKNASNKINTESLDTGFIGEKIRIAKKNSVAIEITRVLMDFSGTGDITLYLYNTNSIQPVETKVVTIASDHQIVDLNWKLNNTDGLNGGDWYIGYYTDEAAASSLAPYERDYNNASYESSITYVDLFKTFVKDHVDRNLWDLDKEEAESKTTGMNLDISVYYDYTDLIIQNKFLFADAICLEAAILFLNQIKASLRANKGQRIANANLTEIETSIEGQTSDKYQKVTGLRPSLNKQLELIQRKINSLVHGYRSGRITTIINV